MFKIIGRNKEDKKEQYPTTIIRWYDKNTRSWIVQLKDQEGHQIGEAIYIHSKIEAIKEETKLKNKYGI